MTNEFEQWHSNEKTCLAPEFSSSLIFFCLMGAYAEFN